MKPCPRCNYEVQEDQTACPNCGVVFAKEDAAHSASPPPALPLEPSTEVLATGKFTPRHQKYLGFFLIILGLTMCIFELESPTFAVAGIGWLLSGIGLALYAKGSGRSLAWSLLALWAIVGPIIGLLAFAKNKKQASNVSGNKKKLGCLKGLAILFLSFMGFVLVLFLGIPPMEDMKNAAAPVIAALDKYRSVKGGYPDSLDKLVPEYISEMPGCKPSTQQPQMHYWLSEDSGEYILSCTVLVYMRHSYSSDTKQWRHI